MCESVWKDRSLWEKERVSREKEGKKGESERGENRRKTINDKKISGGVDEEKRGKKC